MKSILLHANQDAGLESRLQAALDLVRLVDGHLTCLHTTPYEAFITGDPFGGVYALPVVVDQLKRLEDEQRARLDGKLANEGVAWDWLQIDGPSVQAILDRSRLADLVVLSLAARDDDDDEPALSLAATVAIHSRAPVLAVPQATKGLDATGPAMVAWNGSPEVAHALRFALPMLRRASEVHVVTVTEDCHQFPATEGCRYLALHGVGAELHEWPRNNRSIGQALLDAAASLDARYIVMGAYGHSRLREAVLGGVTREMMRQSPVPLLLGH
ncbi:MAG TPA: universal stress protein [Allosphingosinicella sp.]|nr:universal stress protein [Allosphingosinicella sp.]